MHSVQFCSEVCVMASARKKAKLVPAKDCGVSQPADTLPPVDYDRIMFVDAGCNVGSFARSRVVDSRPTVTTGDVEALLEELEVGLIAGVNFNKEFAIPGDGGDGGDHQSDGGEHLVADGVPKPSV